MNSVLVAKALDMELRCHTEVKLISRTSGLGGTNTGQRVEGYKCAFSEGGAKHVTICITTNRHLRSRHNPARQEPPDAKHKPEIKSRKVLVDAYLHVTVYYIWHRFKLTIS